MLLCRRLAGADPRNCHLSSPIDPLEDREKVTYYRTAFAEYRPRERRVTEPPVYKTRGAMDLGSMRVSKADGSQALDLQRDALLAEGIRPQHLYEDLASGPRDDRPGLAAY